MFPTDTDELSKPKLFVQRRYHAAWNFRNFPLKCWAGLRDECFYLLDILHCHLVFWVWNVLLLHIPERHTLLGCPPILKHKADDAVGPHACHTVTVVQRRAERRRQRVGVCGGGNFGCMACGVRITIFSAALLQPHSLFNYHLLQRERERKKTGREEQGQQREGRRRWRGGAQWCGGWGSRCEKSWGE